MKAGRIGVALAVALGVAAVCGWLARPTPTPERAIRAGIAQFCDNVATWHIHEAMGAVSKRFHSDSFSRGDMARGLLQMRQTWRSFRIYVAGVAVTVDPDGRGATAVVDVSLSGTAASGREQSMGEDKPVRVQTRWEREGRTWRCVGMTNAPNVTEEGFG